MRKYLPLLPYMVIVTNVKSNEAADSAGWVFDLFGDSDMIYWLYSGAYLDADYTYHFSHWAEQQFFAE